MELELALIRMGDAILGQKSFLKRSIELAKAIPEYRQVLVSIGDPNSPDVDASDNLALQHQKIVERKIAVRHDRIGREG